MKKERLFVLSCIIFTGLFAMGCSDDNGGDKEGTTCREMYETVCEKACECPNQGCYYFNGDAGARSPDEDSCVNGGQITGCDTGLDIDCEACADAIVDAECEGELGSIGLKLPTECSGI